MKSSPSRLLNRLEAAIAEAATPLQADCLRAEVACYLARQGHVNEAKSVIVALRQQYDSVPNVAISAWLSLAEGLEGYFRNLGAVSRDKVLRAYALSAAAGLAPMQALSAAWLAQLDFTTFDFQSIEKHARQALKLAKPNDSPTRARVSLVLAQALHLSRRLDLALPWYRRAHAHATEQGDDATVSAWMHNMACMRLDNLRQFKLTGLGDESDIELAQTGTESTGRFDQLFGASSFKALNPLLRARILSLQGRPAEALVLYQEHISIDVARDFSRMQSDLLSDMAWCRIQLDQREGAVASAIAAEASLVSDTQVDDRAATHTRLSWLYLAIGDIETAQRHEMLASQAWDAFVQLQGQVVQLLEGITENG